MGPNVRYLVYINVPKFLLSEYPVDRALNLKSGRVIIIIIFLKGRISGQPLILIINCSRDAISFNVKKQLSRRQTDLLNKLDPDTEQDIEAVIQVLITALAEDLDLTDSVVFFLGSGSDFFFAGSGSSIFFTGSNLKD